MEHLEILLEKFTHLKGFCKIGFRTFGATIVAGPKDEQGKTKKK
jgi:hypothetical protein